MRKHTFLCLKRLFVWEEFICKKYMVYMSTTSQPSTLLSCFQAIAYFGYFAILIFSFNFGKEANKKFQLLSKI